MSNFKDILREYADGNYDCAKYSGFSHDEYQEIYGPMKELENHLIARDEALLAALKECADMIANECADAHYHDTYLNALEVIAKAEGK